MNKEKKVEVLSELSQKFADCNYFYITDTSALTAGQINKFRKLCFDKGVEYKVFKNTLIAKALEKISPEYADFNAKVLKGSSGVIFASAGNLPARIITEFKESTKVDKIVFKGASVDGSFFIGSDQLETLTKLKSKQELIGEIVGLLQSPAKNVVSALQSGGNTIAGLVKTLQEKGEQAA